MQCGPTTPTAHGPATAGGMITQSATRSSARREAWSSLTTSKCTSVSKAREERGGSNAASGGVCRNTGNQRFDCMQANMNHFIYCRGRLHEHEPTFLLLSESSVAATNLHGLIDIDQ